MERVKRLIIVRHGNTFKPGEIPTRIGAATDMPLVEEERGRSVGKYLLAKGWIPDEVFTSPLQRTFKTAELIIEELGLSLTPVLNDGFVEIDYGPDENKTEEKVVERLGKFAMAKAGKLEFASEKEIRKEGEAIIDLWNRKAIVPDEWRVNVPEIINNWKAFAENIENNQTVVVVSSNGIIRFAPYILDQNYDDFCKVHDIKVTTGGVCVFEYIDDKWMCKEWNVKPYKTLI